MTQLVGRILRQPDTIKTNAALLDECYVFCHHSATRDVVTAIKNGLEQDGMADLAAEIKTKDANGQMGLELREIARRDEFKELKIFLPLVLWSDETGTRGLDYDGDVLFNIDWSKFEVGSVVEKIPETAKAVLTQIVRLDFEENAAAANFLRAQELDTAAIPTEFDPAYLTRSIVDIVPNPWIAREYVDYVITGLKKRGFSKEQLSAVSNYIVDSLRSQLIKERDRLAEDKFLEQVEQGVIQFRLRTDGNNWMLPELVTTNSPLLQREDGKIVEKSLFDPLHKEDLNQYEQKVACYLDSEQALKWWHRNVARKQYGIQGWRRHKVYPDFIFALTNQNNVERMFVLETKADHLDNPDTAYKAGLLEACTKAFRMERVKSAGELELVTDEGKTLRCELIFEDNWKTELSQLLES
jgi:type III restriction enzyme